MRHLAFRGAAVGAALALTTLTACSSGDSGADDDRLRYAYAFTPVAALSPYSDDAVTSYGVGATETLAALDSSGEPQPRLATSWEQVDDTTWELEIREGVVFHDGTELTAESVVDSLTYAAEADPRPRSLSGVELSAEAVDDATVRVTTADPDPILIARLTSPELVILAESAYDDPAQPDPVGTGTGPYEITQLDGTSGATLDAYADYWNGEPPLEGIDVSFVAEGDSRASSLRSGQVELAQALPASQLDQLDDGELLAVPLPRTIALHLTQTSDVFSDPGLRATASEALDDLDIADTIYGGYADPADGLFVPDVSTWAADRPEPELPEASDPSGQVIELATFSDRPELVEVATAIADAWRAAGFEVNTTVQEYNQLEEQFLDGTFDAVIMSRSYGQDTADPISYLQTDFGCEGTYNISVYCDESVDGTLVDAAANADLEERNATAVEVESTLLSQVAVIPLVHEWTQFGVVPGLSGLAEDPWERAVITAETTLD